MSDEIDDAQQLQIRQTEIAIEDTIDRLKGNGLHDCEDCGDPIEPARRAAYPSARRCIDCQRLREKKVR